MIFRGRGLHGRILVHGRDDFSSAKYNASLFLAFLHASVHNHCDRRHVEKLDLSPEFGSFLRFLRHFGVRSANDGQRSLDAWHAGLVWAFAPNFGWSPGHFRGPKKM